MTTLKIGDVSVNVHVDFHGNLYLELHGKLFQLNIDENDEPYFDVNDYRVIKYEPSIVYGKIVKSGKFYDDTYFPENNGHTLLKINDDMYDEFNEYDLLCGNDTFEFYDCDSGITVSSRINGEILALYDTFIYDDNNETLTPKLVFQTKLRYETCIYRVSLYTSGKFFFRPIGCFMEKKYELYIVNDNISVKKL